MRTGIGGLGRSTDILVSPFLKLVMSAVHDYFLIQLSLTGKRLFPLFLFLFLHPSPFLHQ